MIKSRTMRWEGHVQHMGERRGVYRVLVRKPEGKRPFGRRDNIQMDLQEVDGEQGLELIWLRTGTGDRTCKHGNQFPCSIKCGEFLD